MRKWISAAILFVFVVLTGCTSSAGIHLFSVQLVGEVRESSLIEQPVHNVQIFSAEGTYLGVTDQDGRFAVKVTVRKGQTRIVLRHADYVSYTHDQTIVGSSSQTVQVPRLYLTPAGGRVSGRVIREVAEPTTQTVEKGKGKLSSGLASVATLRQVEEQLVEGEYNLKTRKGKAWLQRKLKGRGEIVHESADGFYTIKVRSKVEGEQVLQELRTSMGLEYIEPNQYVHLLGFVAEDEMLGDLWNLEMIGLPPAWQYSTGSGVKVAVLDSMYWSDHPDLRANLLPPLDARGNTVNDLRLGYHGMHVAGTIGAVANQDGVIGVAPHVLIQPIRVFRWNEWGKESADVNDIVLGISLAIEAGVDVINMSFGMPTYSAAMHEVIKKAYSAGIVLVAASGNNGSGQVLYPAAFPEVIAVGAVGPDGKRAYYSQYGEGLEIVAPGGNFHLGEGSGVKSTVWNYDFDVYTWEELQGTSMAAPHVTGVIALLMASGITDPDQIRLLLRDTARDIYADGYDSETGYGLLDAFALLHRFQDTYVFFGSVTSGDAQLRSPVIQVETNGTYELTGVRAGVGRVVGWIDMNKNRIIDGGDYLGESELLTMVENGVISGVHVSMQRVPGEFSAIPMNGSNQ